MALMVGAMTIHGIVPGPQVMTKQPELFWGMIASMWIGNLALVDHQPAAGRPLGRAAAGAVPAAVPVDRRVLLHRRLLDQQLAERRPDRGDVRGDRLLVRQARLRAGADAARLRARSADGGEPAPRHADRARRRHGVLHAADLGRAARHCDRDADPVGPADAAQAPRSSGGVDLGADLQHRNSAGGA